MMTHIEKIYEEAIDSLNTEILTLQDRIDDNLKLKERLFHEAKRWKIFAEKEDAILIVESDRKVLTEHDLKRLSKLEAVKAIRDPNNKINLFTAKRMIELSGFYTGTEIKIDDNQL